MNTEQTTTDSINAAARCIESADALIITAGAGLGVDSGLPDYRGSQGLWRAYPQLKHLGLSFEEMANPQWFDKDPKLAWAFYGHRQQLYRETVPHRGFALLKNWGQAMPQGYFAYTSNVDGHFQSAGFDQARLVECHGNIHRYQCCEPCHDRVWQDSPRNLDIDMATLQARGELPRCPECNSIARPNVMMFYDWNWVRHVAVEQLDSYNVWVQGLFNSKAKVVVLELGAGTNLAAIRRESELQSSQLNARLIRINPREADGPVGAISIPFRALKALEVIESALSDNFKNKCGAVQEKLDEPPSRAEINDRTTDFFRSNPGGVVLTLSGNHLKVMKQQKVYAKPCQVKLSNGWIVWVDHLDMQLTYAGMIEGIPERSHIHGYIERATAYAEKHFPGPKIKLIEPKTYDASSDQPVLPSLRFIARIECHESRNEDEDGTWLTLVWFADYDDEKSTKDYVADALAQVDWEESADSYRI